MLKIILIALAVLIAAFLAFAATRPDSFSVQRSTVVNAPPEKLFALINDLQGFNRWNPYVRKDPQLKGNYSGPAAGPGAKYAWHGNKDVGRGHMTIAESQPHGKVSMDLEFMEPFAARNKAQFTLQPVAGGTQVTWAMNGPSPYITKVMGLIFNMDKMIGTDFEAGLANLKALAEQN